MIIGLCGYGRSGKDSVGRILSEDYDFKRYAFADAVKEMALNINPWVEIPYHGFRRLAYVVKDLGWERAKSYPSVRSTLQDIGMAGRKLNEHTWLNHVVEQLNWDGPRNVVVTDVRFHNEATWAEQYGFLVRVERPSVGPVNGHESETEVDTRSPSYAVDNDGDLDDLRVGVRRMVEALR